MYDPAIGRFPSVDPIADQFAWASPFNYAENEPVGHIDLWGLQKAGMQIGIENARKHLKENGTAQDLEDFEAVLDQNAKIASTTAKVATIITLMVVAPEVGFPLAVSDVTGAPVTPSPAAIEASIARNSASVLDDAVNTTAIDDIVSSAKMGANAAKSAKFGNFSVDDLIAAGNRLDKGRSNEGGSSLTEARK